MGTAIEQMIEPGAVLKPRGRNQFRTAVS